MIFTVMCLTGGYFVMFVFLIYRITRCDLKNRNKVKPTFLPACGDFTFSGHLADAFFLADLKNQFYRMGTGLEGANGIL